MTAEPFRPAGRIVAYAQPVFGAALFLITSNEEKVRTQCNVWPYPPKAVLKQIAVEPAPPFGEKFIHWATCAEQDCVVYLNNEGADSYIDVKELRPD